MNVHFGQADVTGLRGQQISGEVIADGQPGYAGARRVWNGMIDRRPQAAG